MAGRSVVWIIALLGVWLAACGAVRSATPCDSCEAGMGCCNGACVPLNTPEHCGSCSSACGANTQCAGGACLCKTGFADCDNQTATGCEIAIAKEANNCSACGVTCPPKANATPSCFAGRCDIACNTGFLDCDGLPGNGCEIDSQTDPVHCGSCTKPCSLPNATAGCAAGQCSVVSCAKGFGNCDGNAANGCEANLLTDGQNCGMCANACPGNTPCTGGVCFQNVWTKKNPIGIPSARYGVGIAYDANRKVVVIFGGYTGSFLGDTWEWDGMAWKQATPMNSPPARYDAHMAYDSARKVVVLFGGYSPNNTAPGTFNDTWEYDGTNWTKIAPSTSPGVRAWHEMAYDEARKVTVLFGGHSNVGNGYLADTWEYNGQWVQRSPAAAPSARHVFSMTYDIARKVAVLFGGNGPPSAGCNNSNICGDTWEYDGNNWAQKFPGASPSARYWTSLSYDPRGVSVLFGGYNAGCSNDTWEWDGQNWKNAAPSMSPSVRYAHHLVYDGARGRTLLFGGIDCSVSVNETWVYGGP